MNAGKQPKYVYLKDRRFLKWGTLFDGLNGSLQFVFAVLSMILRR